ncbi:MAG: hypothetical protein HZA61_15500 [Candidatus Eisenbacteria bacterium]|uniref:Uncharacterized protein n=1 Tax=Eiseniibacteriota bacterium TaxID=2212470 RepID=A0A933WC30_UNCEI|nr:hypothetical protein [Candidatus Eisenbacteria bacterium]
MTAPRSQRLLRHLFAVLAFAAAFGVSGCFNPFAPLVSTQRVASTQAPIPSSPTGVVKLFEWCWQNRDLSRYEEIFTDDYRFTFAEGDSAGQPYRQTPYTRETELTNVGGLFNGSEDRLAAKSIQLTLDKTMISLPDPRPGKDPKWHRSIRTHVDLTVDLDLGGGSVDKQIVTGNALFFLVRGDSAAIPQELADRGFVRDSTRWWIERWEDETLQVGSSGAIAELTRAGRGTQPFVVLPPRQVSFGQVKVEAGR